MINFNNIASNIASKMPSNLLPGSVIGGMGVRELFTLDIDEKASPSEVAQKTLINGAIRASSIAFSPYNLLSLPYLTAVTNPIMAAAKGYEATKLLAQGENKEAGKKALEATALVALTAFDYWTLGLGSKVFDAAAVLYITMGAAMDINKSSKNLHEKIFPQEIVDRRRLAAEGFPLGYDEDSAIETSSGSASESDSSISYASSDSARASRAAELRSDGEEAPLPEDSDRDSVSGSFDFDDGFAADGVEGEASSAEGEEEGVASGRRSIASGRRSSVGDFISGLTKVGRRKASELKAIYDGERSIWGADRRRPSTSPYAAARASRHSRVVRRFS